MARRLAFYVTQGSLTVWESGHGTVHEAAVFADNDDGLREFNDYLAEHEQQSCFIVVDVIEEEFALDTVPKLGMRDRKALMHRRLQRKFPRTSYRLPIYQGRTAEGEASITHSAVTNHELLDPWLHIMLSHEIALTGIFSVPLMAADIMRRLRKTTGPTLLLTQHQQTKLRQVFFASGYTQSARLSQSPDIDSEEYARFLINEIGRSRRYLERTRLLSGMEPLDVFIVANKAISQKIIDAAESDSPMQIHCIGLDKAASVVGLRHPPAGDRLEMLFIAAAFRQRPKQSYATSGESRYWHMRRVRHTVISACTGAAAVCAVAAGLYISDALLLKQHSQEIEQQLVQLTETFRRENEQFDPIKADSHEMKLAVDTGDFILENRLPVPWVMQQVGLVLGDYPDVQVLSLGWTAQSAIAENAQQQRRGEQPMPVPVSAITAVNADITASITPFDGNMRRAFARIDSLVAELEARTVFTDVVAVEYPIETHPKSAVSGEYAGEVKDESASFRLRLRYPLQAVAAETAEVGDDAA